MDTAHGDELVYLFSNVTGVPEHFFQGYAHIGYDYIHGQAGAEQYQDATGRYVMPGEDGCYFTITPTPDGPLLGVDLSGLKKMFLWSEGGDWCVSNSLTRLRDHVAYNMRRGMLEANPGQLYSLLIPGHSVTEQISHRQTLLKGVTLVPLNRMLLLTAEGPVEVPTPELQHEGAYVEDLADYTHVWRSRLHTLIADERVHVSADLSGGLDSRVVFGLAASATGGKSLDDAMTLVSGTGANKAADYAVAETIATHCGGHLNRKPAYAPKPYTLEESFPAWHDLNVGVYLPIYQPRQRMSPWAVNLSGLGGENHRLFYPDLPPREFAEHYRSTAAPERAEIWRSETTDLIVDFAREYPTRHPLITHYREFRGRAHGGMFAQTKTNIMPFASKLMEPLESAGRRVYFDILANSIPELVDMPFDEAYKAPTAEERENIVRFNQITEPRPGNVYAADEAAPTPRSMTSTTFADAIWAHTNQSADPQWGVARDFFGPKWVDDTLAKAEQLRGAKSLGNQRALNNVSRLITMSWLLEPDNR